LEVLEVLGKGSGAIEQAGANEGLDAHGGLTLKVFLDRLDALLVDTTARKII